MAEEFRRRWWVPLLILVMGPLGGAALGVLTNSINGWISLEYFSAVMGWGRAMAGDLVVTQGMLEGGALGAFFGVVVAISFAATTRLRGGLALAVRAWLLAALTAIVCWTLGAACGATLGYVAPGYFQALFPRSRSLNSGIGRFGWVGGSIWGAYADTGVGCILACVYVQVKWRSVLRQAGTAFEVLPPRTDGRG